MKTAEIAELVSLAEERNLVLMPGHLLLYHPGVQKLKRLVETGESQRRVVLEECVNDLDEFAGGSTAKAVASHSGTAFPKPRAQVRFLSGA